MWSKRSHQGNVFEGKGDSSEVAGFHLVQRLQECTRTHLVPKHFRSRKGKKRVGPCQGWYALSSERGIHYIGLVGEWRTKKQRDGKPAGQSTNTFYRRWIQDSTSHDNKGGFGEHGQNGTWPKEALQNGKLLGNHTCRLHLAPVTTANITYRKSGTRPNFCEPGREQANLITSVEQYLIHRYANKKPSRKTSVAMRRNP